MIKQYKNTSVWCDYKGNVYVNENGNFILKNPKNKTGDYLSIRVKEMGKSIRVHRIIATVWLKNKNNKPQVNHKNGNKQDNRVSNLEWVTAKENNIHAWETGLSDKQFIGRFNKENAKKVLMLSIDNEKLFVFDSAKEASEVTGVCERNIHHVCNNKENRTQAGGYRWRWFLCE